MQGVAQLGNGGDLVRLAVDLALPRCPQYSLSGGSLCPTRTGRAPVGSRPLRLAHRVRTPSQGRAAVAVFLSFRRAIAWGDRTSRRCRAATAAGWSSGLIMPLGLPLMS